MVSICRFDKLFHTHLAKRKKIGVVIIFLKYIYKFCVFVSATFTVALTTIFVCECFFFLLIIYVIHMH
jgi:hypothetical protein